MGGGQEEGGSLVMYEWDGWDATGVFLQSVE